MSGAFFAVLIVVSGGAMDWRWNFDSTTGCVCPEFGETFCDSFSAAPAP
jgi:hypothetical protein